MLLPPANEERSLRRLCFYTCLSVILFTGWGCLCPGLGGRLGSGFGVSRPTPTGEVGGGLARGVSRPTPRGEVGGSGQGCPGAHPGGVQAHVQGVGAQAHTRGIKAQVWGVYPSMHCGRYTPQQMATAAGGTHPTGMHSCW